MGQRQNNLTPEAGPRHLLGAELRAWRLNSGMSLANLGRELHCDASYLARIERAERSAPQDLIKRCDELLRTGGALERLYTLVEAGSSRGATDRAEGHRHHVANPPGHVVRAPDEVGVKDDGEASLNPDDVTVVPVRAADGRIVYVPLPRRRFLKELGVAAAAVVAVPARPASTGSASSTSRATAPPVAHFRQMRAALADSDNLFGPRRVISTAHDQINLMQQLRRTYRGADLKALVGAQTEFADLLGWLHQDSGDHHAAQFWLDRALEWSHLTDDGDATAFILARKSQLAGDMGDGVETVEVADAAIRTASRGSRLAAIAATYAIRGYALQGDRSGCAAAYDRAHQMWSGAEHDDLPWGRFFDAAYIDVHHAESRTLLGDYVAAADEYRTAIAALPSGFRRDLGVYLAREALAYAGAEQAERAAELGLAALAIEADAHSGRIVKELTRVHQALRRWASVSSVRTFCDATTAVAARHQL